MRLLSSWIPPFVMKNQEVRYLFFFTVPITVIPEIAYVFPTTIPPPPPSFNPLLQKATPIVSEETTSFLELPNLASVFGFNDRVTKLERGLSEMKQIDQYAQAISLILAIEPSHTVGDPRVQHKQEFDAGNNDKQPDDEAASKVGWFKKPKQTLTLDPDWNKRQHVDFRPPQTCISNIARAENPPT
uniref:Uncharacterized protein n=1 Tax=Tanacetum cinerariifolium TaxID=118510 RepID=A0A6L2MJQ3_TANCI|nr:hypothetical protein [Tanacetum cinerariifolium]